VRERHELAQRDEGQHAEQQRRDERAGHPGDPEQHRTQPDSAQVVQEAVEALLRLGRALAQRACVGDDADDRQQAEQQHEQQRDLLADVEVAQRPHVSSPRAAP
jgi:hypothetical protein